MLLAAVVDAPLCVNCSVPVDTIHIQCASCSNVTLCLTCFSFGAQPQPITDSVGSLSDTHLPTHKYYVRSTGGPILLGNTTGANAKLSCSEVECILWTAEAELALLQALEIYGINWQTALEHILLVLNPRTFTVTKENNLDVDATASHCNVLLTPDRIKEHYEKYYMFGRIGNASTLSNNSGLSFEGYKSQDVKLSVVPSAVSCLSHEQLEKFMYEPKRQEFTKQYNDGVERILNSVLPNINTTHISSASAAEESGIQDDLLLSVVKIYCEEIQERERRTKIVHEYGLMRVFIEHEKILESMRQTSRIAAQKRTKKTRDRLRKFCKFLPVAEFSKIVKDIRASRTLRRTIAALLKQRISSTNSSSLLLSTSSCEAGKKKKACSQAPGQLNSRLESSDSDGNNNSNPKSFLSQSERNFCSLHGIPAHEYVILKAVLIQEYIQKRSGMPVKRSTYTFNEEHRLAVENYLDQAQLIIR